MYPNQQYQQQQQAQQPAPAQNPGLIVQGRIVWTTGKTLFEGKQKVDYNTNAPLFDETGAPIIEYGFGLSIPKIDPQTNQHSAQFTAIWNALYNEAFTLYPTRQLPPDFALKFKDGDGVDHEGKPFGDREGYKGCIVLACTTRIPIKYFIWQGNNNIVVNDGIKCGDYVNVQLNIKAHPAKGRGKAGLYVNPSAVQLITAGKEIINTPSGDQLFGMQAPSYAGQVVAPVVPTMPMMNAPAPMGAPVPQQQQYAPPMQQQPYQAPVQTPAPQHYNVLPENFQPNQGQQQYAPPVGNGYNAPPVTGPQNAPSQGFNDQNAPTNAYPSNMPPMPR